MSKYTRAVVIDPDTGLPKLPAGSYWSVHTECSRDGHVYAAITPLDATGVTDWHLWMTVTRPTPKRILRAAIRIAAIDLRGEDELRKRLDRYKKERERGGVPYSGNYPPDHFPPNYIADVTKKRARGKSIPPTVPPRPHGSEILNRKWF